MTVARRRFWAVYNVAVLLLIVGIGVAIMLSGGVRGLVGGAAMILLAAYLAVRTSRPMRGRAAPQVSDVRLGAEGVLVLSGDPERPGRAFLSWADCVAVVASPVAGAHQGDRPLYYLHFMPARDSAVVLTDVPAHVLRGKAALVDLPTTPAVAMVWLGSDTQLPQIFATLDHVRTVRPQLRVIDSIRRG